MATPSRRTLRAGLVLFVLALGARGLRAGEASAPPWEEDARALLDGVTEVAAPGVPGFLVVWGEGAFPLVVGRTVGTERAPVVAAARRGRGRLVAFAHGGYLSPDAASVADTGRLLRNAVRWAGPRRAGPLRVGFAGCDVAAALREDRIEARRLTGRWTSDLGALDVLVLGETGTDAAALEDVDAFVRRGGGLLLAQTGWGWLQLHPGRRARDIPFNRLGSPAGLAWSSGTVERTSDAGFAVRGPAAAMLHAGLAVRALSEAAEGSVRADDAALRQAAPTATSALEVLPSDDRDLRPRIAALLRRREARLRPTPATPLTTKDPLDRFLLAVQVREAEDLAPGEVRAHPAAASFPGAPAPGARPVSRSVEVDLSVPGWHGTGVWAPAGQVLTVRAPADAAPGLRVRIGCHADALWHLESWARVPEITREQALEGATTHVASPFGGLVYLVVPASRPGRAVVTLDGGVDAPRYVLGATTAAAWSAGRRAPGPWAELETSKVVLTVPAEHVRGLEDPEPLLRFWDRVLDAHADLAATDRERRRPERIVADVQISAGYMHAGYPIMTHLDAAPRMVDLATMRKGDWGLFHELGHNHQEPDWTFEGAVEVTVNLFTLHAFEAVCGAPDGTAGHDAFRARARRTRDHVAAGAPFARWKADPFLALSMYVDLKEAFGWGAFRRVFAEYRALPPAGRPATDDAKRDQWMVRMSRAVGRDLGPFFEAWGVPTSEAARASVRSLPPWMPRDFPARAK